MYTGFDTGLSVTALVTVDDNKKIVEASHFGSNINDPLSDLVGTNNAYRYKEHCKYLKKFLNIHTVGTMIIEQPFSMSRGKSYVLNECFGAYLVVIANHVPKEKIFFTQPTTIKKYFTGYGSANKVEMLKKAEILGYDIRDNHEADALAMALMGLDNYNGICDVKT